MQGTKKRYWQVLLTLSALVLAACASGSTSTDSSGDASTEIIVGAVSGSAANPAVQVMNAEMEKRAAELGVTRMLKLQKVLKNKSKKRTH